VPYTEQLATKETWLRNLFGETIPADVWQPIMGTSDAYPTYFRNKIRFSFIEVDGVVQPSRHQKGSEEADIPVDRCFLQSPECDVLMNLTAKIATDYDWSLYSPTTRSGWLKHLLVRQGKQTGEFLVALVTDDAKVRGITEWVTAITSAVPQVKSVYHSQSWGASTDRFEDTLLWGEPGITERIGKYTFWISPHAFFQTNGSMVGELYNLIGEHAGLQGTEHVWDLYAGSATIGIFLSDIAGRVTSIESNPANCGDADWNLRHNAVTNVTIHQGNVEDVVTSAFCTETGLPDVVIIDPPRAGLHERFRTLLPNLKAQKIIYASCNPATCLRDIQALSRTYRVTRATGIDMFPHTWHCELVLTLEPR
jgi:23S rRNA (uracil1939-C5)-methyltransferase